MVLVPAVSKLEGLKQEHLASISKRSLQRREVSRDWGKALLRSGRGGQYLPPADGWRGLAGLGRSHALVSIWLERQSPELCTLPPGASAACSRDDESSGALGVSLNTGTPPHSAGQRHAQVQGQVQ